VDVRGSCGGDMRWELMEEMRGTSGNLVGDAFTIALLGAVVHGENTTNSIFIWPFFHTGVTIVDPLLNWLSAIPFYMLSAFISLAIVGCVVLPVVLYAGAVSTWRF